MTRRSTDPGGARSSTGYGLDDGQRRRLPARTAAHVRGMHERLRRGARTGAQPWARLWAEGHGEHWGPAADYVEAHVDEWVGWLVD